MRKQLFIGVIALGLSSGAFANGVQPTYAPPAPAAPAFAMGPYVGLQLGYGWTGWHESHYTEGLNVDNVKSSKSGGFAGRVYIGYDLHPNFAVEFGYTPWFVKPETGDDTYKADTYPWALDLVGKIKAIVADNFGLYAKAGGDYIYSKLDSERSGKSDIGDGTFNVVYGVGAYYDINQNIFVDLAWTRYHGNREKSSNDFVPFHDLLTLGVAYKFTDLM